VVIKKVSWFAAKPLPVLLRCSDRGMFDSGVNTLRIAQLIWPGRPRTEWESVTRSG
jgi:hypothetical protein